jgi:hypothetical protein
MNQTKTFLTLARRSFPFCFGGIWLFCGLPFLILGVYFTIDIFRLQQRFRNEALVTEGMVLTKTIRSNKDSKNYRVGYRFRAPDGSFVKSEANVTGDFWDRVTERGPVRVMYLSSDPKINHIEGAVTGWMLALVFAGLGFFFVTFGGLIFLKGLKGIVLELRLERTGAIVEATVIHVGPAGASSNGVPQWRIRYRYQDYKGQKRTGESGPMSPAEAQEWKVGDKGTARFDPKAPQKSAWAGRL